MSYRRHLVRGLRLLGERRYAAARRWIEAGDGGFDKAIRMAMVGVGGYILWRVLSSSWRTLAITVVIVCLVALRAATKAAKAPPKPAPVAAGGEPEVTSEEFLALVWDALGDAKAVHLNTLAAALTDTYGGAWKVADARRLCEAAGVAVTPTVRAPGGRPTVGVYRADVPPLPRPSPEGAPVPGRGVVVAGQSTTTSPTTGPVTTPATSTTTVHGGLRIMAMADPDNPARTHVQVIKTARRTRA